MYLKPTVLLINDEIITHFLLLNFFKKTLTVAGVMSECDKNTYG